MSASPVRMALEIQSPVTGDWEDFERGEHEIADFVLADSSDGAIDARCRLAMGSYVQVIAKDGTRYTCRYTPESWLRRGDNSGAPK